jgi:hypothetical protein
VKISRILKPVSDKIGFNISRSGIGPHPMGSEELILGFYFLFIYKDFFFRELSFCYKGSAGDASCELEKEYARFYEQHLVFWLYTMQSSLTYENLFKPYSSLVIPAIPPVIRARMKEPGAQKMWALWSYQINFRKSLAFMFDLVP